MTKTSDLWRLVEAGSPVAKALALTILDNELNGKISELLKKYLRPPPV